MVITEGHLANIIRSTKAGPVVTLVQNGDRSGGAAAGTR